jgi:mono/diheme cytochrome c family protein
MTAIRYPWRSVNIRLIFFLVIGLENGSCQQCHGSGRWKEIYYYLSKVDFPAPRNPEMIVNGTLAVSVSLAVGGGGETVRSSVPKSGLSGLCFSVR